MKNSALLMSLIIYSMTLACTKSKKESFIQGQGKDLLQVSALDGAEFELETLEKIISTEKYQHSTSEQVKNRNLSRKINLSDIKNEKKSKNTTNTQSPQEIESEMSFVKVKTRAEYLGDTAFIGFPNIQNIYKIKYQINSNYLIVLKLAPYEYLHPKEIPGAVKINTQDECKPKDFCSIPVVGYPIISYFNIENVDANGEKSNKLVEMPAKSKLDGKYFKINKNMKLTYRLQDKLDVFDKSYFIGKDPNTHDEWYYAQTIISASQQNQQYVGWNLVDKVDNRYSMNRIRFALGKSEMSIVSTNFDPRAKQDDELNQLKIGNIPIEWKSYRREKNGVDEGLNEEENTYVDWNLRRFIKIDFINSQFATLPRAQYKFVDLEIDTDYFSYTLLDQTNMIRIKMSFKRVKNDVPYLAKLLFQTDFEKFGYFSGEQYKINTSLDYRKSDFEGNKFINRFNTNKKTIDFYFTDGSDPLLVKEAIKACDAWTLGFKNAGLNDIKIICHEFPKVALGDIRFNQINLINSINGSGLFGYGPSVTDPKTGEIISATTNMHMTSIRDYLIGHIRSLMYFKAGVTSIYSVLPENLSQSPFAMDEKFYYTTSESKISLFKKITLPNQTGELRQLEVKVLTADQIKQFKSQYKDSSFNNLSFLSKNSCGKDISLSSKSLNEDIQNLCPNFNEIVTVLAESFNSGHSVKKLQHHPKEAEIILECANKVLPQKMMGTLLHELGHNFGLRHNFKASTDKENFLSKEETKTSEQVRSSSIMEYSTFGEDRLQQLGKYDIAAIRFGYGDSVELTNGQIIKLDVKKSIDENISTASELKKFKFCTDEDVDGDDPMCARHDAGTNPKEIALSIIHQYNQSIAAYNYKLDKNKIPQPANVTNYRIEAYWIPLKRIYDEWRFKLADHMGPGKEYLDSFDENTFQASIQSRLNSQKPEDQEFRHYKEAAEIIFEFAFNVATLPPRYCLGERNNKVAAVEFAEVRKAVFAKEKVFPKDCKDNLSISYIKEKYDFTPSNESGFETEDLRFDKKINLEPVQSFWGVRMIPEAPDVIGLNPEKDIAMQVLTSRLPLSSKYDTENFHPNFMDEPKFRNIVLNYVSDRLTKGFDASVLDKNIKKDTIYLEKFKYERKYLESIVKSIFGDGLEVPEKSMATKQRKKKFTVKYSNLKEVQDKAKFKIPAADGINYYCVMSDEGTEAKKLLMIYENLPKRLANASPVTEKTFDELINQAQSLFGNESQLDSVKLADFMAFVYEDVIKSQRSEDERSMDRFRVHWKKVLNLENSYFAGKITEAATSEEKINWDAWARVLGPEFQEHIQKSKPDYNFNVEILKQRIEDYKKEVSQSQKSITNDDIYEFEQLTTQQELIQNVLRTMTEW